MKQKEAEMWLRCAGYALGEAERYWFGSLYDLGRDMVYVLQKGGPEALVKLAKTFAGPKSGPKLRAICLFGRAVARMIEPDLPETPVARPYGLA